jgi:hypothetical protein
MAITDWPEEEGLEIRQKKEKKEKNGVRLDILSLMC